MTRSELEAAAVASAQDPAEHARYAAELEGIHQKLSAWRKANPDKEAFVQFNYPPGCMMIAVLKEALRKGIVVANEAGREMIAAICDPEQHTCFMLRLVLEHEPDK